MIKFKLFSIAVLAGLPALALSYDNAFVLGFENSAGSTGFSDTVNGDTIIVAGESAAADSPAYTIKPENAAGYNGTKWLRVGAVSQISGVSTVVYDGQAGGTTTDASNFVYTADVYINPSFSGRYQVGPIARWTAGNANSAFQVFYSSGTPIANSNGYGWRAGGVGNHYAELGPGETTARWVRFKMELKDAIAKVSVDRDLDGTYDYVSPNITLISALTPGKIGIQTVINDPNNGSALVPNQFGYIDNMTYTPLATVSDWSVY